MRVLFSNAASKCKFAVTFHTHLGYPAGRIAASFKNMLGKTSKRAALAAVDSPAYTWTPLTQAAARLQRVCDAPEALSSSQSSQ